MTAVLNTKVGTRGTRQWLSTDIVINNGRGSRYALHQQTLVTVTKHTDTSNSSRQTGETGTSCFSVCIAAVLSPITGATSTCQRQRLCCALTLALATAEHNNVVTSTASGDVGDSDKAQ